MPELSRFFGISIKMFPNDHYPPHFHAIYQEYSCSVDIQSSSLVKGNMPRKQLKLIEGWTALHNEELIDTWNKIQTGKPIELKSIKINPLSK